MLNAVNIRYEDLASMLADRVESVCQWLLPNGHREGHEWRVGNVYGDEGHSLGVNLAGKAGTWKDFASDEGGDLIDLICAVHGVSVKDAASEAKEFLGIRDKDVPHFAKSVSNKAYVIPDAPRLAQNNNAVLEYLSRRGISAETVAKYRVEQTYHNNKPVIVFPYQFDGKDVLIKYRPVHNKKGMWVSSNSRPCLFGWQAFPERCRFVVITEGEIDALSFAETGTPALSVPFGGGTGDKQNKWIDEEYEHLQQCDTIFLALDADDEGKKATSAICERLGAYRCRVLDLGGYKDANEAMLAGFDISPASDIWANSRTLDPEELHRISESENELYEFFNGENDTPKGDPLPWKKTESLFRLRNGETTIWAGISGHGKSQFLGHVLVDSMFHGRRWCVASMEFRRENLLARLVRQALGKNRPDGKNEIWEFISCFDDKLWLFDAQGDAKGDRILEVFEYCFYRYGIRNFLIDSLAKCGFAEDDYNSQKNFIDKLSSLARKYNIQIHIVCHSRKTESEEKIPDKFDVKGTGALTDMVDNVIVIWRNKPKENSISSGSQNKIDEPDCFLCCYKQRNFDWEGKIKFWFDKASLQYLEYKNSVPIRYC